MRPQLYRNLRGQGFAEIPGDALGSFFQKRFLGRGLATLDWNRDGRADFAVSNLHDPFSLVTNQTRSNHQPLVIKLAGRTGSREPIGATVRMQANGRDQFRLYTGGDGYLVSNEHRMTFWVPATQKTVDIEVRWPGGKLERWQGIGPGNEYLLIEGTHRATILRQFAQN